MIRPYEPQGIERHRPQAYSPYEPRGTSSTGRKGRAPRRWPPGGRCLDRRGGFGENAARKACAWPPVTGGGPLFG